MKLSEAIRLGAMLKPQGFGVMNRDGKTCALGAALEAVGHGSDNNWMSVYDIWPVTQVKVTHPLIPYPCIVGHGCWALNDCDHLTREQIADWVETVERAQEQAQPQPDPPVAVEA